MSIFSRPRTSQAVDRMTRLQVMMDTPFGGAGFGGEVNNAINQVVPGALTTYGLGTAVREGMTPQGNTAPNMGGAIPNPVDTLGRLAQNIGGMIRGGDEAQQPSLSEDEYKASPYFRTDVPFEQGMTEDRAAALATFYDQRKVAEYFSQKRPVSSFIGQFVGQAFDPINYVPVFGEAAQTAATARLGTLAGRMVVSASDAAINTAVFGVLTGSLREEFGDDVSWQAMVNEIGMSALVGGAFGAGAGALAMKRELNFAREDANRAARRAATLQNNATDQRAVVVGRAVLNESVGQMVNGQPVNPSPNTLAEVERLQAIGRTESTSVRALREQTANVTGENVAITPSGQRVNVQPEIVDASTLVRATGDLQVRNRSSMASRTQVEQMATELDPVRLMPSVDADSGAPIVGSDNIIDSGNGRVMAINRAYEAYPERAAAYRKALEDAGYVIPPGVERPVLISRRTTELSRDARAKFNEEANAPRAAQMSAVELAAMDRNALDGALDVLDVGPVTAAGNRSFVQRFLGNLTPSARGALIDGNGALNADGARRIENALVAEAYGDVDASVLRRFAEATDDNTRAIVGAMSDAAGRWAQMRREVKAGNISPEFDATTELTQALRLIGQWRDQASKERRPVATVIKEGMGQIDLLDGQISPEAQVIISAFYKTNAFSQAAGRDTIAEFLGRVVDAAVELGRPQLFETADVGKLEVLRNAAVNEQGNLFTPISAVDGIEADGGFSRRVEAPANRQDGGQGAGAGGSIANRMTQRFEAAGRPADEARATAELVDAFYAQQAARLGISTDELEARFGLPEVRQGGDMADDMVAQSPGSPAFREWFGDSKVVDANGEPLVVYHGGVQGIEQFESSSWRYRDYMMPAAREKVVNANFFAKERRVSQTYSDNIERNRFRDSDPASNIYEVYLKLENPLVIDWKGKRFTTGDPTVLIEQARSEGKDGLIVNNVVDDRPQKGKPSTIYVTFDATQIKSTANRGTFDPNDPRLLFQVSPDQARAIDIETKMPDEPLFSEAVGNTEGAQITPEGLMIDLVRYQKDEQSGSTSVRTGVFYLPTGSATAKHYKGGKNGYGGRVEVRGETLIRRPIFVKGATGGKAPEAAFDQIKGKGAYEKMRSDVLNAIRDKRMVDERGYNLLEEYGADGNMIWEIVPNSTQGNTLAYALQENIVAHAVREAGYDAVIGHSKAGGKPVIAEVFDVREIDYPTPSETATLHPDFDGRRYRQDARGAIRLGDTSVISLFETADASTALHETGHLFLSMLKGMGEAADAPTEIRADWESVQGWWRENADAVAADANASGRAEGVTAQNVIDALDIGTTGDAVKDRAIDVGMQEQWARGFEAYVREGNAPNSALARAFEQFRQWLTAIYRRAADLNVNLSPEMRQVFDNLLGTQNDRAIPTIDGQPVRLGAPPTEGRAPPQVAAVQASMLMDNEPDSAASRVGKDDTLRDIALSHGVDPNTGAFVEQGDIDQIRQEGRLTPDDEASLAAADQMFADAEAYGRAIEAAMRCVI